MDEVGSRYYCLVNWIYHERGGGGQRHATPSPLPIHNARVLHFNLINEIDILSHKVRQDSTWRTYTSAVHGTGQCVRVFRSVRVLYEPKALP